MADDLNDIHEIADFSTATLRAQIERLAASEGPEQLIYRECELDEIWRLVDLEIASIHAVGGRNPDLAALESLRAAVMEAHDLVGVEGDVARAAARLRDSVR